MGINQKTLLLLFLIFGLTSLMKAAIKTETHTLDPLPPGWEYNLTPTAHNISIPSTATPSFAGELLGQGDFIGVFYLNDDHQPACGGAVQWTGEDVVVTAFGNDAFTPEKDGFKSGDRIIWKIYRQSAQQEYFARVTYNPGMPQSDGRFYGFGFSQLSSLNADHSLAQAVEVPQGWRGVSLWVDPHISEVAALFAPFDQFIFMSNNETVFYPAGNLNTLKNWNINSGYLIKTSAPLTAGIDGFEPLTSAVELNAGWNLIPVLTPCAADVEPLFENLAGFTVVKEVAGDKAYWPHFSINTLGALQPGQAYWVATTSPGSIVFGDCEEDFIIFQPDTPANIKLWNPVTKTPGSHLFAVPDGVLSASGLQTGDILGVFNQDGLCTGQSQIEDLQSALVIAAFANDTLSSTVDGFIAGETAIFKMYRPAQQQESLLEVEFDSTQPQQGVFAMHGISAITAVSITAIGDEPKQESNIEIYPNPGNGEISVRFSHPKKIKEIMLKDVWGNDISGSLIIPTEIPANGLLSQFDFRISQPYTGICFLIIKDEEGASVHKVIVR